MCLNNNIKVLVIMILQIVINCEYKLQYIIYNVTFFSYFFLNKNENICYINIKKYELKYY